MVSLMNNRVLFIVEGENAEVELFSTLLRILNPGVEYDFYSYSTNIHSLAQILFNNYRDFDKEEIDIRLVLRSEESDEEKRSILSQKYRDIFLIFDFDPQHDFCHFDTVRRMIEFFDDSTSNGKLFINYPMLESVRHLNDLPDDSFKERNVSCDEIIKYKELVSQNNKYCDYKKYDYTLVVSIIVHHLKKLNYILTGNYSIPSKDDYYTLDYLKLFDMQVDAMINSNMVYVINTSVMLLIDFNPTLFYRMIDRKATTFNI